jgi:hypothetical protein
MIRVSDLTNPAAWARPATTPAAARGSGDLNDPSSWFDGAVSGDVRIGGDPPPHARGLSAEQHAARVLGFLCGDRAGL